MANPLPAHLRKPLTVRFQQSLRRISNSAAPRVQRAWRALDTYDESDIETFATAAAPTFGAAKTAAVRQAAGYYALTAGIRTVGVTAKSVPVVADPREPFISTWQALKSGRPYDEAVEAGNLRIEAVVSDLVESSARQTGDVVVEQAGLRIVGWERIPDDGACPYCEEVAPGFYSSAETADAVSHNNCGCSVEPIYGNT